MTKQFASLDNRAVLEIGGPERVTFLQGLISNDVTKVGESRAIYAALLTAQGRFLHDLFLAAFGDAILVDAEAARFADLTRRLTLYRLRAKVTLTPVETFTVAAAFGDDALLALGLPHEAGAAVAFSGGVAFVDPRSAALGMRLIVPRDAGIQELKALGFSQADFADYDRLRLSLGIPDGSRDLVPEKALLMESGFDALNGIDWDKGCYIGQELTARMKYRALVKKQLMPVTVSGPLPPPGTAIVAGGEEVGEMRSGRDGTALALLRLDSLDKAPLRADEADVTPATSARSG